MEEEKPNQKPKFKFNFDRLSRLIETGKRMFIAMPYKVHKDEEDNEIRRDMFHPVSADARKEMESAVITAYNAKIEKPAE